MGLKVEGWCKFRHAIGIAVSSSSLISRGGIEIPDEVKRAYCCFGYSHYQIITNLGYAKLCIIEAMKNEDVFIARSKAKKYEEKVSKYLHFHKCLYETYFHLGSILDAVSRIVYLLCDEDSTYEKNQETGEPRNKLMNIYWLSRHKRRVEEYGFTDFIENDNIKQIINIRDHIVHCWLLPFNIIEENGRLRYAWPIEVKSEKWLDWPHDEAIGRKYDNFFVAVDFTDEIYFKYIENYLNDNIFSRLIDKIEGWEKRNGVIIRRQRA